MKRTFTICIIANLFVGQLFAQELDKLSPKWELGVDLYSIFFNPTQNVPVTSTYGLIVKRNIKNNRALRFRTNFGFEYMPDPIVKGANQPREYNLSFDFGYEKQNKIKRFVHYYGGDLLFQYRNVNSTTGLGVNGPNAIFDQEKGYSIAAGIAPFIGGKFLITDRISIALETNCALYYSKYNSTTQQVSINNDPISEKVNSGTTNGIIFNISPISAIYLNYNF